MDRNESTARSGREASMEGNSSSNDPFGLGRRRRRIPASLEAYLTPQINVSPRQDQQQRPPARTRASQSTSSYYRTPQKAPTAANANNNSNRLSLSPLRNLKNDSKIHAPRVTLETTMESTSSLLTTPASNPSPPTQQPPHESPAHWNISRISPQDTLSIMTPPHHEEEENQHRSSMTNGTRRSSSNAAAAAVDTSLVSQTMRKQLLQLVHSLQTNLNESQEIRGEQVAQLKSYEERMVALQKQVEDLQQEKEALTEEQGQRGESFQRDYQQIKQECREKDIKVQELQNRLHDEVEQTQKVQSSLQNLRLEHASLTQQLQQQTDAKQSIQEAQEQVEQKSRQVEQERLALLEKQERWHQEHKELKDESSRIESFQNSLQYERQLLAKERQQVQETQKQLVDMQATQMEMEETQRDEDDRIMRIAHQLDERHSDLEYREGQLALEKQEMEAQQRQQEEGMLAREAHLRESAQSIVSQQSMLETWNGTLQEQKDQLEEREKHVKDVERAVSAKVDDLTRLETKIRKEHDDLEQRSQSYEAKHLLTIQALQDLTAERAEQEARLETALSNLEEVEQQTTKIKTENQHRRDAMQEKLTEAQNHLDSITSKIATATDELNSIKEQSKAASKKQENDRQEAAKEKALVRTQLHQVQDEIEDAESHKATLHLELLSLKSQLETMQYAIDEERAEWEEQKAKEVRQEDIRRSEQLDTVRQEIQSMREGAKNDFVVMQTELQTKQNQASEELIQQMDQIDRMRNNMEDVAKSWTDKHTQLEVDRKECAAQQKRLDQLVAQLEGARDDQEWRRGELDRERQRFETLLSTEHQKHREEMQRTGQGTDEQIEELRQEHREEIEKLSKHFNSDIADLQERYDQIQQQLAQQELQHQAGEATLMEQKRKLEAEVDDLQESYDQVQQQISQQELQHQVAVATLMEQKRKLESDLASAQARADEYKETLNQLQLQITNLNSADSEEREKIRLLIERLELSNENMEQKEADLLRREEELRVQKDLAKKQFDSMTNASNDLQRRIHALRDEESKLVTIQSNLERQDAELEAKKVSLKQKAQRAVLQNLMHKTWREDQEVVSAAFSKWLRVTMMESTAEDAAVAEQHEIEDLQDTIRRRNELVQRKEAEVSALKVELQDLRRDMDVVKQNHAESSNRIEVMKADLDAQTLALRKAEDDLAQQQLQSKIQNMAQADELKIQREQLIEERSKLDSDRAAMAQLDKFLQTRQKQMAEEDRNRTPPKETAALERKLAEETRLLEQGRAELASKEQDVLDRMDMVQEAETRMLEREEQLSNEGSGYKRAQDRVRKLAEHLQQREAAISQKESQLSFSLKEFNEAQLRVRLMAKKLKEKNDELDAEKIRLNIGTSRF